MTLEKITIPARPGLDPVTAYFDDMAPGEGRVVLVCYDLAIQAYWGAMGDCTVKEFFAKCGPDYICNRMGGRHYKAGKVYQSYMQKIVTAVHQHLNQKEAAA